MTVNQLVEKLGAYALSLPDGEKIVRGCYAGDLLSRVMSKAHRGNVWVTIMSNINVPAVATISDLSCVIIAENARPDEEVIAVARARGINILLMNESTYEICVKLSQLL